LIDVIQLIGLATACETKWRGTNKFVAVIFTLTLSVIPVTRGESQ